jgi:hypothetical protein
MDTRVLLEANVSEQDWSLGQGTNAAVRQSRKGAIYVAQAAAKYQDSVLRGNVFFACNPALHALSVDFNTTTTGFVLTNPPASGKNLSLLQIRVMAASAPSGITTITLGGISTGAVTHTTALIVYGAKGGALGANSVALVDEHATTPQHVAWRPLGGQVAASSITPAQIVDNVDGAIILTPGASCSISALTTAINAICSITWEELPV